MTHVEKKRLDEIEKRITRAKHLLEGLLPVHVQVDRRVKSLSVEINHLEDERLKLRNGQLKFSELGF